MMGKKGKKAAFAAFELRKLPLQACINPKSGHFYPLKVPLSQ